MVVGGLGPYARYRGMHPTKPALLPELLRGTVYGSVSDGIRTICVVAISGILSSFTSISARLWIDSFQRMTEIGIEASCN